MIEPYSFYNWELYINEYIDSFLFSDDISSVIDAYRVCWYYFNFVRPVYSFEQLSDSLCFSSFDPVTWWLYA